MGISEADFREALQEIFSLGYSAGAEDSSGALKVTDGRAEIDAIIERTRGRVVGGEGAPGYGGGGGAGASAPGENKIGCIYGVALSIGAPKPKPRFNPGDRVIYKPMDQLGTVRDWLVNNDRIDYFVVYDLPDEVATIESNWSAQLTPGYLLKAVGS